MAKRCRPDDASVTDASDAISIGQSPAKLFEYDTDEIAVSADVAMQCSLPPHKLLSFTSSEDFDVHYAKEHTNRCTSCSRNFPSAHYLSIHIDENHNPLRELLAAKGEKTYACFVEDCDRKCSTPQKRRRHVIDKHGFPEQYNFRIVDQGIDRFSSLLQAGQKRRVSVTTGTAQGRQGTKPETALPSKQSQHTRFTDDGGVQESEIESSATKKQDVDIISDSLAALKFVPPSVQAKQRAQRRVP